MRFMLDTNICIYLLRRRPAGVLRRLESLRQGDAVLSVVTYAELRAGLETQSADRSRDERALRLLAGRIPVIPFTEGAAERYGMLRALVRDRRRDALDRLIAAHALSLNVTLVTNNIREFCDYPGLLLENWAEDEQTA